jgi:hypothetical protein
MKNAYSGFQAPLDSLRNLRVGRFIKTPVRTDDCHFLLGRGAGVLLRNRPLRVRIQRLSGCGWNRGRREKAERWHAPRLR